MKIHKILFKGAASALALTIATAASAAIVPSYSAFPVTTSSLGYTTQDFSAPGGPYGGTYGMYSANATTAVGSIGGITADPPPADTNRYLSVAGSPGVPGATTVTLTLNAANNYFGLYWGSIDTYNYLRFYNGATLVLNFTGTQALALSGGTGQSGNQTLPITNGYFEFNFTGLDAYTRIEFVSDTLNAFESDNHTVRIVPEPGTLALFGAGLMGMWMAVRRRKVSSTGAMNLA